MVLIILFQKRAEGRGQRRVTRGLSDVVIRVRDHRSHCRATIRPAVSSLKGQKSIRPHYGSASMSLSPPDTHWSGSRTHPPPPPAPITTLEWSRFGGCTMTREYRKVKDACSVWISEVSCPCFTYAHFWTSTFHLFIFSEVVFALGKQNISGLA